MLFRAAHRQLLARQILLPGHSVLMRLIATVRERATHRVHSRLARAAGPELRAQLDKLLLVPEGQRRSELDLLRRPPFTPTIAGLVRALDRLDRIRALGAGELDLSGVPPARVVALARYADQAWATQLADLGSERRIATLVAYTHLLTASARDDVIDIFDVVFGDLQRAATHRGQKCRAGELRDYDQAVAAVHARMRSLLDALDEQPALAGVLAEFRAQREGIEENMGTVDTLMRPPGDPFHERLVAAYPQIRRFLPRLIEAVELQAIDSAAPVLAAYHALGEWLTDKPRTTRRPAGRFLWRWSRRRGSPTCTTRQPAPSTAPPTPAVCSTSSAPGCAAATSTPLAAPGGAIPAPNCSRPTTGPSRRDTLCEELALDPNPATVTGQLATSLDAAWRRTAAGYAANPDLRIEQRTAMTRSCSRPWTPRPNPPR